MPETRSSLLASQNDIFVFLDAKFDELKEKLVEDVKNEIKKEMQAFIITQEKRIVELESTVAMLQKHVSHLKQTQDTKLDDLEQYGRRLCVRIDGVPEVSNESNEQVFKFIAGKIKEIGEDIPTVVIDRAHRIGKSYNDRSSNKMCKSIIVRFTTFRHRTLFYRSRKKIDNIRIHLDLTKSRYKLLSDSIKYAKDHENKIKYVFVDINCRLKARMVNDDEVFIDDLEKLKSIVESFP